MSGELGRKLTSIRDRGTKAVAVLVDPDDVWCNTDFIALLAQWIDSAPVFVLVGGSLIQRQNVAETVARIKDIDPSLPVLLFPGSTLQISDNADGILFLSLISGRNPDLLVGQHVAAAPLIAATSLEVLSTAYLLFDGGKVTSVHYLSQTIPLPNDKPDLALATALAGYYLGMSLTYLEAGSGAPSPVSGKIIRAIRKNIPTPLIVGGGINSPQRAVEAWEAGADVVVIGNGLKKNPSLLTEVIRYAQLHNLSLNVN